MTRKRWNSKALAERRRRALQLHLTGFTHEEIAEKVGVDRSVVSRNIHLVRDGWFLSESPDLEEARAVQMATLDQLQHAYWVAWEKSKLEKETKTAQRSEADGREQVALKRERQSGNPAFLMGIFRCIVRRDAVLGLSRPSAASAPPPRPLRTREPIRPTHGRGSRFHRSPNACQGCRIERAAAGRPGLFTPSVVMVRGGE